MRDLLPKQVIKHKRPIKYLIAGGIAAFVDLSLLYFFTDILGIWYLISACLAFVFAFFVSFFLQKFWTFRDNDKERMYRQMTVYLAVALINFIINAVFMFILVDGLKFWYMLAQVFTSGLIACESYYVYKILIFNKINRTTGFGGRVLIATGVYPPSIGGPATYAAALKTELSKLGCEIRIVTFGSETKDDFENNIFYISRTDNIVTRYFKFFMRVFSSADWADIIYTLDLMSAGLPAILAAALKRKKVIFRTGGDFLWEKAFQSGWTTSPLAKYYEEKKNYQEKMLMFLCRWLLSRVDLVFFSTEFQAKIYRDYYRLPDAKIKIMPNASPKMKTVSSDYQYRDSMIFAGRLIKLKNLHRLIGAFALAGEKNLKLTIFGQGPERENLAALIKSLGLSGRAEIRNQVAQEKLISLIGGCKFFILPSITEISPNLALECLSLRKPIILTKETGLKEELVGRLVKIDPLSEEDIKDKIKYLADDNNLLEYKNSLERLAVEPREWSEIAEEHFNIFKEILQ